jgi:hypothetical protein
MLNHSIYTITINISHDKSRQKITTIPLIFLTSTQILETSLSVCLAFKMQNYTLLIFSAGHAIREKKIQQIEFK